MQNSNPESSIGALRLGIFGGSFDPVHRGHLLLAECCLEQAKLDQVWFVPTAAQPLKPRGPRASEADRLAMLELVIKSRKEFLVSTIELERGGVSYTVDTLKAIGEQHPEAELFFLMGADSLAELPQWHRATEVCELATPLVVRRAGAAEPQFDGLQEFLSAERAEQIRRLQVEMPATPISSSEIRRRISAGEDYRELVAPAVADFLEEHQVYRDAC